MRRQVRLVVIAAAAAAVTALAGCDKGGDGGPAAEGAAPAARDPLAATPMPAGAVRVTGNQFHVDVAPAPGCQPGGECAVLAELTAAEGFKVNHEYPFKFVPAAGGPPVTSSFAITAPRTGRLVLRAQRPASGPARVAGDFKLSVCNPDQCLIETAAIAADLP